MSTNLPRKPYKVEFLNGPLNGAVRYYSTLRVARTVARKYVNKPLAGRVLFTAPCCEIYFVTPSYNCKLLDVVY